MGTIMPSNKLVLPFLGAAFCTTIMIFSSNPKEFKMKQTKPSYYQEDVSYKNTKDDIALAGTLTLPSQSGTFPTVLLIAGMGPNDRDYTMFGRTMFLEMADYLTKQGIGVLRVDKRGIGQSTGIFNDTVTSADLAQDVQAGVDYLKTRTDIDTSKIGLLGHSEGGLIASMVTATRDDIAFVISMAGVVTMSNKDNVKQVGMLLRADNASQELIEQDGIIRYKLLTIAQNISDNTQATQQMKKAFADYWKQLPQNLKDESATLMFAPTPEKVDKFINMLTSPSYRFWMKHDPAKDLEKITCPILGLYGDKDFIVASSIGLPIFKKNLAKAGNTNVTALELPNMNHWLQTCKTGAMQEYMTIKETITPSVLTTISDWIVQQTK
jgi:uncharacterized protein